MAHLEWLVGTLMIVLVRAAWESCRPAIPLLSLLLLVVLPGTSDLRAQRNADPRRFIGITFTAAVTSIVDGDTLRVVLPDGAALTIRLDGIDAPEKGEPYSTQARNAARVMVFAKPLKLKGTDVDHYSRLVARLSVDGVDSSVELVRAGLACHFTRYSSDEVLAAAQRDAQNSGRGFWAQGAPKPACAVGTLRSQALQAAVAAFHGNTFSRVFHHSSCRNYNCRNCTALFASAKDAVAAGFKPAGDCLR